MASTALSIGFCFALAPLVARPSLQSGKTVDKPVRHMQPLYRQRTAVPLAERRLMHMSRMEEVATMFARVEELAQQLLDCSRQHQAGKLTCEQYLYTVEEIAWKFFDAVRQS